MSETTDIAIVGLLVALRKIGEITITPADMRELYSKGRLVWQHSVGPDGNFVTVKISDFEAEPK